MKLTLRWKNRIMNGMIVAAMLLIAVSRSFNDRVQKVLLLIAIGLVVTDMALIIRWWRCPSCGTYLGRTSHPTYCPHCGEKIDYDAK